MLVKLGGKDSQTVVKALIKNACKLPQDLYQALTWDRGTEMHAHKQFTLATKSRSTSATHKAHGSVEATKTRTVCSGNTCQRA